MSVSALWTIKGHSEVSILNDIYSDFSSHAKLTDFLISGNKPNLQQLPTLFINGKDPLYRTCGAKNWKDGRDLCQLMQPVSWAAAHMSHLTPSLASHVRHLSSVSAPNGNEECGAIGTAGVSQGKPHGWMQLCVPPNHFSTSHPSRFSPRYLPF